MKGAYSDPESILGERIQQSIFPDTTYGVDSGGDPTPHPGPHLRPVSSASTTTFITRPNARIYFYGDDDPPAAPRAVARDYLSSYEEHSVDSTIGTQPRFAAPKRQQFPYAVNPDAVEEPKYFVAPHLAFARRQTDADERRALQVLEHALLGTPGSPA